jgi:hypothetical protein
LRYDRKSTTQSVEAALKGKSILQETSSVTTTSPNQTRWFDRSPLRYAFIFIFCFVILFLGMDRGFDYYDEGLILVGAMRVAAGQVPHRDFYANYGPGQFYTLAWLFDLFGQSVFVERLYDLTLRSAIVTVVYGITAARCQRWIAACTTIVCAFWLFSAGLPTIGYPIVAILPMVLLGSALLLPIFRGDLPKWRALLAGGMTGLAALFRYDVGIALAIVQLASITIAGFLRQRGAVTGRGSTRSSLLLYSLGIAALFLPPALLYLAVAPIHPFVHDIFLYPVKYYARARRVPFPGIRWRSLENLAVYLPVVVAILCVWALVTKARDRDRAANADDIAQHQDRMGALILFGLLGTVFFFKGVVRISVAQMLLSLVPTVIALAVLYAYTSGERRNLHRIVQWMMALSIFTATWSVLKEVRVLHLSQQSVLQEVLSPPGPASLKAWTDWCGVPNRPLHTGLCFLVDPSHANTISYLLAHTNPSERIFIGLSRHDRIVSNDLLTYFASDRLPATRWSHFDPDLQTRADIQTEMIQELDRPPVRYVVLESQFDSQVQPWNDSSKSSGVTLLDDYIRRNYRQVQEWGAISVWLRQGAQP